MRLAYRQAKGLRPGAKGLGGLQNVQGRAMKKIESFHDLIAWQKGMDLAEQVHRATRSLPNTDLFTIGNQMRRAATSIPANVAEGFTRRGKRVYRNQVAIALGSNAELRTLLELCRRISLLAADVVGILDELSIHVGRLLYGLWRSLAAKVVVEVVCYSVGGGLLYFGLWSRAAGIDSIFGLWP